MEPRVLDREPVSSLDAYVAAGGGLGLDAAQRLGAVATIEEVEASGLRGRGGAGFPTGRKWQTVATHGPAEVPRTVVVNAAEGEPGTFKDRAILRANPYRMLEGALVAALAVGGADRVVVAMKSSFGPELARVRQAVREVETAGWAEGVVTIEVFAGPEEYLFGEETGLLEALNGRPPFPRLAPPYRHGADEIGFDKPSTAGVEMAAEGDAGVAPPTLVNNAETLANVPAILARGADWFRSLGTDESPGTIVCTVSGDTRRAGVGEFPMGTPLAEIIDRLGDGPRPGRRVVAVLPGVANPLLPAEHLAARASYEGMEAAGSGLGSAGFLVFDDETDPVAVAQGAARFLAVESCGQCTPCKGDGLEIAVHLERIRDSDASIFELGAVRKRLATVTEGARCFLAHQQAAVVESVLRLFPEAVRRHVDGEVPAAAPVVIAPLVDIDDGVALVDEHHTAKQPDWTYDERWSGEWPADAEDVRAGAATRR